MMSPARFGRYLAWASGDPDQAMELYNLNIRLSEALYPSLHFLEVALRNRIHAILCDAYHDMWFDDPAVIAVPHQRAQVAGAVAELVRDRKRPTADGIVSALTFSFWTTMLSPAYETLWHTTLHRMGRQASGKGLRRKDFSGPLTAIRQLRNRIAHHEPILSWNLPQHHLASQRMTDWISPIARSCCDGVDRFRAVYPRDRFRLAQA